jgi:hypothetical protein
VLIEYISLRRNALLTIEYLISFVGDRTRLILVLMLFLIAISIANGANLSREVPASDVLAKIKAGQPAEFDNCTIVGNLNLSVLTIDEQVHFNNTRFQNVVNFNSIIFNRDVYFEDAKFNIDANFVRAKFNGNAHFKDVVFNGNAIFRDAEFSSNADFQEAVFNEGAAFSGTTFGKKNQIGYVAFSGAIFNGGANFFGAAFGERYDHFEEATFNAIAFFDRATFDWFASFEGAKFNEDASFKGVTFSVGYAHFIGAKFKGYFYGWYDIKNALAESVLTCDEATYLGLIENFKDHGQSEEANDCYYIYRFYNMKAPSDYLAWITCGFGVKWLQTIYFGTFVILLFGLVYFRIMVTRSSFSETATEEPRNKLQQLFDSIWFSAMVLLSVPSELYPKKTCIYKEYTREIKYHLPILERLIGWGILILFINTLSRTMLHS